MRHGATAGPEKAKGVFRGNIDHLVGRMLRGWAYEETSPARHLLIDVLVDHTLVASGVANRQRMDLAQAGIGKGDHAFEIELPRHLFDGEAHSIVVMARDDGWYLPEFADVMLKKQHRSDCVGKVVELKNGQLLGFAFDTRQRAKRVEVALLINGKEVARTLANREVATKNPLRPEGCGFVFDLADFSFADLLGGDVSVEVAPDGPALDDVARVLRGIARLAVGKVSNSVLFAGVQLRVRQRKPIAFDVYLNGQLSTSVAWQPARAGVLPFQVFLSELDEKVSPTLSVRLGGSEIEIHDSPQTIAFNPRRNLVSNPRFRHWSGSSAIDWTVTVRDDSSFAPLAMPGLRVDDTPLGPDAISLSAEGDSSLTGACLRQTLEIDPSATTLDLVVGGRADTRTELMAEMSIQNRGGNAFEARHVLTLWSHWGVQRARVHLPAVPRQERRVDLTLLVDKGDPKLVQIGIIAVGEPGFTVENDWIDGQKWGEHASNAVRNGDFAHWSRPFRQCAAERRVQTADDWFLVSEPPNSDLKAWLTDLTARNPAARIPGYGLALLGPAAARGVSVENTLDELQILTAPPRVLTFFAQPASALRATTAASPSGSPMIGEIFVVDRELKTDPKPAPADNRILTIARNLVLRAGGDGFSVQLPARSQAALMETARKNLHAGNRQLVLVFGFRQSIDCVLADVALGNRPAAKSDDAPAHGYIALEDANIALQVPLIKEIERWADPSIMRPPTEYARESPQPNGPARKWDWSRRGGFSVEIVICVHDAIDELLACLDSVRRHTTTPHTLLLVDDKSSDTTREQIRSYIRGLPWMRLLELDKNLGYTKAANAGLRASRAEWIVLLNSDTIVTPGWLEGMFEVLDAAPDAAMIGPLSNAASWQSVPELRDVAGGWKINQIPEGFTVDDIAGLVAQHSSKEFPEATLLNGFCTLIRRSVLEEVGFLDELAFPMGYGEENDLCIRVRKAGHKLFVADHVYVYHQKSASFGKQRRQILSTQGTEQLLKKHPDVDLRDLQQPMSEMATLIELRKTLRRRLDELRREKA